MTDFKDNNRLQFNIIADWEIIEYWQAISALEKFEKLITM